MKLLRDNMSRLIAFDIVQLIYFLDVFVDQITFYGVQESAITEQFKTSSQELLLEYLERIKSQVKEWFANIKAQETQVPLRSLHQNTTHHTTHHYFTLIITTILPTVLHHI